MKKSLFDFLVESWHLSYARASFFLFGFISILPMVVLDLFLKQNDELLSFENIYTALRTYPLITTTLLILSIIITIIGKSFLITHLNANADHSAPKNIATPITKSIRIESTIILFVVFIVFLTTLPMLAANEVLGVVPNELGWLSTTLLLFILVVIMVVREYALIYTLLTPLGFRSTFESASKLYIRFQVPSLLYAVFMLLATAVFTFFSNLVMLGIVALLQSLSIVNTALVTMTVTSVLFSGFAVYEQALWLTFFRSLALPPKDPAANSTASIVEDINNIPEITV